MLAQAGLFSKKKETEDQHASSRMVQVWPPGPKVLQYVDLDRSCYYA